MIPRFVEGTILAKRPSRTLNMKAVNCSHRNDYMHIAEAFGTDTWILLPMTLVSFSFGRDLLVDLDAVPRDSELGVGARSRLRASTKTDEVLAAGQTLVLGEVLKESIHIAIE